MIEKLNGTTETVNFTLASNIRLYHNNSAEDFPLHWHVPGEIICPIQNTYNVTVADEILYLKPHDILFIGSGELHSITAPKEGERYILNFSTAMFEPFHELALFFATLHPFKLLRYQDQPQFNDQLLALMTQMEKEYFGAAVFQDCELSSLMLHFFAIIGRKLHQNAPHENISSLRQKEQQERFSMLCNYINAHCTEDLSLDELANEAGFSKYHFARLFTQARACDHCVILRRIKFNRRIRIKSRRMVSVMKVKFDRHKGRVFFTGEFYQELAGNSIRILFLYASHFQDRFDAVGTQRNLAAASFCAMFPRKIHAKDGRFIRRITDNAHTNAVNQPAEAFSCLQHLQNVLVLNATHDFCACYQTLIVQENRKSVGFCIGAPAADGLINQNIQSLSLRDGIPWSNSLISHIPFTFS